MWRKQFPSEVKYRDNFVLNGKVITLSVLEDITYGYWGKATGYGRELLYWGGGYAAQLIEHPEMTKQQLAFLPILTDPSKWYGDYLGYTPNSDDHDVITWGVEWYNSSHKQWYNSEALSINFNSTVLLRADTMPRLLDSLLK